MARQQIDTTTNNGTFIGDPAKTAFEKVNAMTNEIYGWAGSGALAKLIGGNGFTGAQAIQAGYLLVNPTAGQDQLFFRELGSDNRVVIDAVNNNNSAFRPLTLRGSEVIAATPVSCASTLQVVGTCTSAGFRAGGSGIAPSSDGAANCGNGSQRWGTVFATSGTINTSDAREKEPVQKLSANELKAGLAIAAEFGKFRFLPDTVAYRVESRQHIGMTVQRLIEIFKDHELDALDYAMVSHDAWEASPEVWQVIPAQFDSEGVEIVPQSSVLVSPEQPAGDRYGFRMDQLNAFVCRALYQRLEALEARFDALEALL